MTGQPIHGWIFFWGEARTCVGYDVSKSGAQLHSDELKLLPINFYVTFDDFLTVAKCRLAWRRQDDISVVFEEWVDDPFEQLRLPLADHSKNFRDMIWKLKAWRVLRAGISVQ